MKIQGIRGMKDILPGEVEIWHHVEAVARHVMEAYGFSEMLIPILERTELFARSIGESTDIVEKEMYTFTDRKGHSVSLRPEATTGILRSYIEHSLYTKDPFAKFYAIGPMFRYERPQKGRYRQFYQIDAEILGSSDPRSDAELLAMLRTFFSRLGIHELEFQVNNLGCRKCRPKFRENFLAFVKEKSSGLCEDCLRRIRANPLRIFDCKVESCKEAIEDGPTVMEFVCSECSDHFDILKRYLSSIQLEISVNPRIVRGLDYYTRTTFELISPELGVQKAIVGGGRYDMLIYELGGPDLPGIGFAIGMERLVSLLIKKGLKPESSLDLFIAALGKEASLKAFPMVEEARREGLRADMDFRGKSLKAQMRRANKLGAKIVMLLGDEELASDKILLRDMRTKEQKEIPMALRKEIFRRLIEEGAFEI